MALLPFCMSVHQWVKLLPCNKVRGLAFCLWSIPFLAFLGNESHKLVVVVGDTFLYLRTFSGDWLGTINTLHIYCWKIFRIDFAPVEVSGIQIRFLISAGSEGVQNHWLGRKRHCRTFISPEHFFKTQTLLPSKMSIGWFPVMPTTVFSFQQVYRLSSSPSWRLWCPCFRLGCFYSLLLWCLPLSDWSSTWGSFIKRASPMRQVRLGSFDQRCLI